MDEAEEDRLVAKAEQFVGAAAMLVAIVVAVVFLAAVPAARWLLGW